MKVTEAKEFRKAMQGESTATRTNWNLILWSQVPEGVRVLD